MKRLIYSLIVIFVVGACVPEPTEPLYYELEAPSGNIKVEIVIDSTISLSIMDSSRVIVDMQEIYMEMDDGRAFGLAENGMLPLKDVNTSSVDRVMKTPFSRNSSALVKYNGVDFVFKGYGLRIRAYDSGVAYRFFTKSHSRFGVISENADFVVRDADLSSMEDTLVPAPLIVKSNDRNILISDNDIERYPKMYLLREGGHLKGSFVPILAGNSRVLAYGNGPCEFPWRVIGYSNDKSLLSDDLMYLLGDDPIIRRTDWIKPGKALAVSGDSLLCEAVDFASEYGIEYVVTGSCADIEEDIRYAERLGVGMIIHKKADELGENLERAFRRYASMGIKGLRLDFDRSDDFLSVKRINSICEHAAQAGLILDLRGVNYPGLNRKYPNVLNSVGSDTVGRSRIHYVTDAGRMAGYIVFDSPLPEIHYDNSGMDSLYADFMSSLPVTFDRVLPLDAVRDETVVISRKKGKSWYVAGKNAGAPSDYTLDFGRIIVPGESYSVTMLADSVGGTGYMIKEGIVDAFDKIDIPMASDGGFAIKLEPVQF